MLLVFGISVLSKKIPTSPQSNCTSRRYYSSSQEKRHRLEITISQRLRHHILEIDLCSHFHFPAGCCFSQFSHVPCWLMETNAMLVLRSITPLTKTHTHTRTHSGNLYSPEIHRVLRYNWTSCPCCVRASWLDVLTLKQIAVSPKIYATVIICAKEESVVFFLLL